MLIRTDGGLTEIAVQTVGIAKLADPYEAHVFHCPYCSQNIIQIQGLPGRLRPGIEPTSDAISINMCRRCKAKFFFTTDIERYKESSVVLVTDPSERWACLICSTPLLSYSHDHIYVLPSNTPRQLPFLLKCRNTNCPAQYYFRSMV